MMRVLVLIITHNRCALLQKCLESLREGHKAGWHIQVVLNGEDQTSAQFLSRENRWWQWQQITQSSPGLARNLGLAGKDYDWIFFLDDDATLPVGYPLLVHPYLQREDFQVFGGTDTARLEASHFELAVALSLASPTLCGPTSKRHQPASSGPVRADETVLTSCHLWVRGEWIKQGVRFPEFCRRGEETGFLLELARLTKDIWLVPSLSVFHQRRTQLKALIRANYWGGHFRAYWWKSNRAHPWWFSMVPFFLILHVLLAFVPQGLLIAAQIYFVITCYAGFRYYLQSNDMKPFALIPLIHYVIHLSYSVGFCIGLVRGKKA